MKKQKLSVCMIVKNEESFLAECLQSVKDVADQIVVVDTGSTDRTVAIAKQFGAEVHHFTWQDDFAAARNASLKYARGNWIFWLDADERLTPESVPVLQRLLRPEKKPVAYRVTIKNVMADGKTFKISTGHRLFTNHKKIYFEGRVHEQIIYSVARNGGEEREAPIQLFHLGYGLSAEAQQAKDQRNRRLLLKMVEEQPQNAYAHYTLGQNYNLSGEYAKALEHYLIALENGNFQLSLKRQLLNNISEAYLKLNELQKAQEFAQKSLELSADQIGAYYLLYKIHVQSKAFDEAIEWLRRLQEKNQAAHQGRFVAENDILLAESDVLFALAELFVKTQQVDKAEMCLNKVFEQQENSTELAKRVVEFWLQHQLPAQAETFLQRFSPASDAELLDLKGLVQIKQENFIGAIQTYTQLFQLHPNNLGVVKRLAGLFFKIGEKEKAESLLKIVNDLQHFGNRVTMQ